MTCEATRDPIEVMNWTCTGEDLVVVIPAGRLLPPAVCPIVALADLLRTSVVRSAYITEPFRGGDHLHVVLDRGWRARAQRAESGPPIMDARL